MSLVAFAAQNRASRHRFLEPIHNVKDRSDDRHPVARRGSVFPYHWNILLALRTFAVSDGSGVFLKIILRMIFYGKLVEPIGIEPMT